ncbi:MAG: hypothetical protein ACI8O8_002843 [Oleiphilaceae bacterium]|jgi:hypothetical protein
MIMAENDAVNEVGKHDEVVMYLLLSYEKNRTSIMTVFESIFLESHSKLKLCALSYDEGAVLNTALMLITLGGKIEKESNPPAFRVNDNPQMYMCDISIKRIMNHQVFNDAEFISSRTKYFLDAEFAEDTAKPFKTESHGVRDWIASAFGKTV